MAIAIDILITRLFFSSSMSLFQQQHLRTPMLFLVVFFFSLCFLLASLRKFFEKARVDDKKSNCSIFRCALPSNINKTHHHQPFFLETLMCKLPKLTSLVAYHSSIQCDGSVGNDHTGDGSEIGGDGVGDSVGVDCGQQNAKRKKKRGKKKKCNLQSEDLGEEPTVDSQLPALQGKNVSNCFYPFTSSSSVTQRKIKMQYDQLVKSHDSKALTLAQVLISLPNCP